MFYFANKRPLFTYAPDSLSKNRQKRKQRPFVSGVAVDKKFCNGCNRDLPIDAFPKHKNGKDGLYSRCMECKRKTTREYMRKPEAIAKKKERYEATKTNHFEVKRKRAKLYRESNPEKTRARNLIGNAVRKGWITRPEESRNWHNRWEFHHPDYSRPYYGVWLRTPEHRLVDLGEMECPECYDYSGLVYEGVKKEWNL